MVRRTLPLFMLPLLASCVTPQAPPPAAAAPTPAPPASTTPAAPAPVADRYRGDWSVDPLSAGEWRLLSTRSGVMAGFVDQDRRTVAMIGCSDRQLSIARYGSTDAGQPATVTVRTSFALRELTARTTNVRLAPDTGVSASQAAVASIDARDPMWDQIIYSRGRFLVEATGMAPLIVPTRPEVARVIEDCRG